MGLGHSDDLRDLRDLRDLCDLRDLRDLYIHFVARSWTRSVHKHNFMCLRIHASEITKKCRAARCRFGWPQAKAFIPQTQRIGLVRIEWPTVCEVKGSNDFHVCSIQGNWLYPWNFLESIFVVAWELYGTEAVLISCQPSPHASHCLAAAFSAVAEGLGVSAQNIERSQRVLIFVLP